MLERKDSGKFGHWLPAWLLLGLIAVSGCTRALAEGWDTFVEWRGWNISSNEGLWAGRKHTAYPLTYLVDGDPNTAWVFSGIQAGAKDYSYYHPGPYHQWIQFDGRVYADRLSIMNGYNRSKKLFQRNNRITQINLIINEEPVKTVVLADRMGWHDISFPRQLCRSIRLVFTGVQKGPDNDTCISEVVLHDRGKKIDFGLPKMVLLSPGEVGDADWIDNYYIATVSGKIAFGVDGETLPAWSPSHRRIAFPDSKQSGGVWIRIVDLVEGRSIYYKRLAVLSKNDYILGLDDMKWTGETVLSVEITHPTGRKDNNGEEIETVYTRKIKIGGK